MSDLISRSELINALKVHFDSCFREDGELLYSDHICTSDDVVDLIKLVENQPTAYSVDEVIKELEENASRYTKKYTTPYGNNGYKDTKAISVKNAIEIVKQGGVSDDVCEWKFESDGEFIQNPHTKRLYSNEPSMKNFYCNTCSKKIKAVK